MKIVKGKHDMKLKKIIVVLMLIVILLTAIALPMAIYEHQITLLITFLCMDILLSLITYILYIVCSAVSLGSK